MKTNVRTYLIIIYCLLTQFHAFAQGWPEAYGGVMLQGFYWDSYDDTSWTKLEAQADEISPYFQLVWVPQSGYCNSGYRQMGYTPVYYFNQNSSFGSETELRRMIRTYQSKGTGIMADVVINHRNNLGAGGNWADYPAESYNGKTYRMLPSDVCADDDGGKTAQWAGQNGVSLSPNVDTGEDWPGCRDIDHLSTNVQECIRAYLNFLLDDIGYTGFRYDMVKGFYAYFIADYNTSAKPRFSVGEFWDSSQKIKEWINNSKGYVSSEPTSAAFDFQFRYRMRDAINSRDWRNLGYDERPVACDNYYRRYAVTFVENHDTEKRTNGDDQDPIRRDTLAANAYLLSMPGTPCVFYRHWAAYKQDIKQMILARRIAGITNTSQFTQKSSTTNYYAVATNGSEGRSLLCVVGNSPQSYSASRTQYTEILSGKGYRILLSRAANTVWADIPDGTYSAPLQVKLTAVAMPALTASDNIAYTIDGSEPTVSSPRLSSGETLTITESCTLKMGIVNGSEVVGVQSRRYEIFAPRDVTLYVRSSISWSGMNFYVWDNENKQLCGNWPGKRIATTTSVNGQRWYRMSFTLTSSDTYINLVASAGTGSKQTVDITGINSDRFLVISSKTDGGKYLVDDVTEENVTPVLLPIPDDAKPKQSSGYFTLDGIRHKQPRKGLNIKDGRKIVY